MGGGRGNPVRSGRLVPAGYSAVLAALIAGPLSGSGYLLLRDAVSTPRSYLTDSALGLGDAAPRAVPQDAFLAAVSPVVDGGLVVKAILLSALWAAGYGAAVLARALLRAPLGAQLVATTVALWNPYVAERLLQGHWSLLTGYAALPWTALAAYRLRVIRARGAPSTKRPSPRPQRNADSASSPHASKSESARAAAIGSTPFASRRAAVGAWGALLGCLAAAGLTPTGALLAGCVALVTVGRRDLAGVAVGLVAASAPWLVATALSGAGAEPSDPAGIAAFAARAEPGLGTLGALAGLGGIWNGDAVPASRTTPLALVSTLILMAIVLVGVRAVAARTPADAPATHVRRALLVTAAAAVVLPALAATGLGMPVMEWLVVHVPGAGLLRDTQKYVALAMPAYTLCAAACCRIVARRPRTAHDSSGTAALVATLCIALLTLPLLDLAWGVGGALRPVRYPGGWERVAQRADGPGDIAVLPGGMFRKFPYSGKVAVLDPAPRMLPRDVLQTGELPVRGLVVAGEGARAAQVEKTLLHGGSADELARSGVGLVLVERSTPGPLGDSARTLATLETVYEDADFGLYRVPGVADTETPAAQRITAILAHLLWAALLIGGALAAALFPAREGVSEP
nr:hypothetical protein [Nocardia arizonensis]